VIRFKDFGTLRLDSLDVSATIPLEPYTMVKLSAKAKGKGKAPPQAKDVSAPKVTFVDDTDSRPKNRTQPQKKSDQLVNPNVKKISPRKSNYEIRNPSRYLNRNLQGVGSVIRMKRKSRMRKRTMIWWIWERRMRGLMLPSWLG
jgi:hypothetical protein